MCPEPIFKNLLDLVLPVLGASPSLSRVIIPPQPRYLFSKCCSNEGHCTNVGKEGHAEQLLGDTIGMRSQLKKVVLSNLSGKTRFWVADTCSVIDDPAQKNITERVKALREVSLKDGVHFSPEGYKTMSRAIGTMVQDVNTGSVGNCNSNLRKSGLSLVSGGTKKFSWHGFCSPVGAHGPNWPQFSKSGGKERFHKHFSPYSRGKGPHRY